MGNSENLGHFHVFLSYSHEDAEWVENLACRLEDERGFRVWLDKWILIPGQPWQQEMSRGLDQAESCAVCIGKNTPNGWFKEEIQKALNRQTKDPSFRVIPVLIPDADSVNVNDFLELRTWADFRLEHNTEDAFHTLACGIKGISPGRFPHKKQTRTISIDHVADKLKKLKKIEDLIDREINLEVQRKILEEWIGE